MSDKYPTVVAPTIHMNGNSFESLTQQLEDILAALNKASKTILESDLAHGRNYFDSQESATARAQHISRLKRLREIKDEYESIAEQIYDQEAK